MTLETKINLNKVNKSTFDNASDRESTLDASSVSVSDDTSSIDPSVISQSMFDKGQKRPSQSKVNTSHNPWSGYRYSPGKNVDKSTAAAELEECVDSDSDLDSILTSSEDEEPETAPADPDDADTDEKQKKFVRFIDRIASSQYFQKATQLNIFKKALDNVSKMPILLTVQLNQLNGTLG